jgi:hypothetical protein
VRFLAEIDIRSLFDHGGVRGLLRRGADFRHVAGTGHRLNPTDALRYVTDAKSQHMFKD